MPLQLSSCTLFSGASAPDDNEELSQEDEAEDSEAEDESQDADFVMDEQNLPHPKKPDAWSTRTLIRAVAQPRAAALRGCMEQLRTLTSEAGNEDDLRQAPANLTALVGDDPKLYHFCFYQLMAKLDERLELGGPVMSDLASTFFEAMKALWILAQALDSATGQNVYFTYLRDRYIQISRDVFGRDVQVVAPPLNKRPRPLPAAAQPPKPAAAVPLE